MTPEWAYGITDIEPEVIRKTAKAMAVSSAGCSYSSPDVTWYGMAMILSAKEHSLSCQLFCGAWGKRGSIYIPEAVTIPKFPQPAYPEPEWTWKDINEGKFPLASMGITH